MKKNEELIKALTTSLEMEKRGYNFYIKTAKRCTNKIGKQVFETLAEDENRHKDAIEAYYAGATKNEKLPTLSTVIPAHKNIRKRLIFGKNEAALFKNKPTVVATATDELKAYEMAMKMETVGYDFYKKAFESTSNKNIKGLYKFLLSEEQSHFELLSNTHYYLENPASWFITEEKPVVEG